MLRSHDERLLRRSLALVWLSTGLLVVHPEYRLIGVEWLGRLGLPASVMWLTCVGETLLGAYLWLRPIERGLAWLQSAAVLGFTLILAALSPIMLAHPLGMLSKNLPFVLTVWVCHLSVKGSSGTEFGTKLLRFAMAVVWITEGIFPKLLFQQELELAIPRAWGLDNAESSVLIAGVGIAQALSGVAALMLRGQALRYLWTAQLLALVFLPAMVTFYLPEMWWHPFGPLTKNLPLLAGTYVLLRSCSPTSS